MVKKKLLFICNVDWFFVSHRLPIALRAFSEGYEVHLACGFTTKKSYLQTLGILTHELPFSRSGTSILDELKLLYTLNEVIKYVSPDVTHSITIKGAIYGGLASRFNHVKRKVFSISGLGYVFTDHSKKARVLRFGVKYLYRLALGGSENKIKVIFQNSTDESLFIENSIVKAAQTVLIRGSGVNLAEFVQVPEPEGTKVVMLVARLLKDKGVIEFCESAKVLSHLENVKFVLVGDIDEHNPNSLTAVEVEDYVNQDIVEHWGYFSHVNELIAKSNIMVLPSYREGLPKSLLEAAACGRAVITTDVPGCRDAIEPQTGVLVPSKCVSALTDAIESLLNDDLKRKAMGDAGRTLAEAEFNIEDVVDKHIKIYEGKL